MLVEFSKGATIIVDKPLEWTSFQVVNKLRWHLRQRLGIKKIKVGHAGTLDPLATGVLVICIGAHTKTIDTLMAGIKTYTGTILLGKTTPSYDLETAFDQVFPTEHITQELMLETTSKFLGVQLQTPPIFSAKQIDGQRAYDLARAGKDVVMKKAQVEIHDFTITTDRFPEVDFSITCSKGTYIRSIAHDFGQALNSGGTLIALRRTQSGEQHIDASKSMEEWIEFFDTQPL